MKTTVILQGFVGEKLCKELSNFQLKQKKEIIFENQTIIFNNTCFKMQHFEWFTTLPICY